MGIGGPSLSAATLDCRNDVEIVRVGQQDRPSTPLPAHP
jgi:hypothetical protein